MAASRFGSLDIVELLLMFGADPTIVKSERLSALEIAADKGHEDIVHLLRAIKLSQSSITTPVLTANEIASNVENETMALINRAMEQIVVEKTETLITAEYKKLRKTTLPYKKYGEELHKII